MKGFFGAVLLAAVIGTASGLPAAAQQAVQRIAAVVNDEIISNRDLSSRIGLAVLDRLRVLDEVAYLRFASVYKNFDAAADFQSELELLSKLGARPSV